ncbi:hypothetical protein SO802_004965 [Lithocarpus litseifolius]|uniref:RNase H type-1 domain-containing protein n=1 Tax=Lithocarpus litseifolius TaxID=425828 RepID=A0AAW2DJ84_9ROSI
MELDLDLRHGQNGTRSRPPSRPKWNSISASAWFTRQLGTTFSIVAEVWALKDELSLAKQLDFNHINVEVDADTLEYMLTNLSYMNLMLEPLLTYFRNSMETFLNCIVSHVYRESNRCADSLAKMRVVKDMISIFYLGGRDFGEIYGSVVVAVELPTELSYLMEVEVAEEAADLSNPMEVEAAEEKVVDLMAEVAEVVEEVEVEVEVVEVKESSNQLVIETRHRMQGY